MQFFLLSDEFGQNVAFSVVQYGKNMGDEEL